MEERPLDNHIESIGEYAFQNTGITSLNLPSTVEGVHATGLKVADSIDDLTNRFFHHHMPIHAHDKQKW